MAGRAKTTTASKEMLTTLAGQAVAVGDDPGGHRHAYRD